MIFLIQYDRKNARTLTFKDYAEEQRSQALMDRLDLEIRFNTGEASQEIILLEAPSREDLKQTHAKYFN
jgi:hypothetical protein